MSETRQDDDNYNNTHRAFLHAFLARQTLTYDAAKPILAAIQTADSPARPTLPEDISQHDLDNYVHTLNNTLSPFDLEIRSSLHQKSKTRVYALVNTTSDALTQMSTVYSAEEMAFVKRLLDAMFDTYNTRRAEILAVTDMQAVHLAKEARREPGQQWQAPTNLTMSQAERVLAQLVAQGWFELSARGFYSLSPRALMELRGWLTETYNDQESEGSGDEEEEDDEDDQREKIKFCAACRDIVTVGQRCKDLRCLARVHDHCAATLFRAQGGEEKCPICKTEWVDPPPVGEKAARNGGTSSANRSASGRRRSRG